MTITVVTAPEATDLTELDTVKAELGITSTDFDTLLTRFIKVSSDKIRNYCGRDFALTTVDETITHDGRFRIVLSKFPVTTVTSVTYKGVAVDSANYILTNPDAGFLDYISTDTWKYTGGAYDYVIRYQYGYVLPSFATGTRNLPYDLEQAAIDLVKQAYFSRERDPDIAKETVPQVYETQYRSAIAGSSADKTSIPSSVATLLAPYVAVRA